MLSASQLAAATAILTLALPVAGMSAPTWRADAVMSVIVLGALGTGVAYVLNYRLIAEEGPTVASTVTYLLPIVAIVLGYLALREPITAAMLGGCGLVLIGVALAQRRPAPTSAEGEPAS